MRRLRRAHQRHARGHKKFKKRTIAAGTAAVITLGAGVGLNKALAYTPDPHELPVSQDADADLLANKEELAIGYRAFESDQNRNQTPDGVELAKRCEAIINELPGYDPCNPPNETHTITQITLGTEFCDICGAEMNMGGICIVNPKLGLNYPPGEPFSAGYLPFMALHYMEHGSLSYAGGINNGRVDVPLLMRVLELRYPYEPNEHQLPLDYVVDSNQLAPDANDLDEDLLAGSEELAAGYNLYDADQDEDLTPDGIELAKQCAVAIDRLPTSIPSDPNKPYKILYEADGLETCEICGLTIPMDHWEIVNPRVGLTEIVPVMAAHYMEHGSLSYFGHSPSPPYEPVHAGRVDIALLAKILEMPQRCGDLGTLYLPGDFNRNCKEDFKDFAEFADKWLESTDPNENGTAE